MRLIDADAIELKARKGIDEDGLLFIPYADVKKSIDNTPTIPQWIPVSERLPSEYEDVLVTLVCTENGGYTGVAIDCIAYDGKWFAHYNDNVVAWMPLPEPYKESDE